MRIRLITGLVAAILIALPIPQLNSINSKAYAQATARETISFKPLPADKKAELKKLADDKVAARIALEKAEAERKERERIAAEQARLAAEQKARTPAYTRPTVQMGSGCDWLAGKLAAHGLSAGEISAAINIASHESGCRQSAANPGSGACNVFQELPCGKWGGSANIDAHIAGADNYAKARYGGWAGAWQAWQAKRWW